MAAAPSLPAVGPELREKAERIQSLTEEMIAGKEAEDWGRVVAAEAERRPLIPELVEGGFQAEGGETATAWLTWLLETEQDILQQGESILAEMREERSNAVNIDRARRAYQQNRHSE
jgi:hypothetical protein